MEINIFLLTIALDNTNEAKIKESISLVIRYEFCKMLSSNFVYGC